MKGDSLMKDYRNTIWKSLTGECYLRLCECRSIKEDLPQLVNSVWFWWKETGKDKTHTKADAVVYIMELLDANSQWEIADLTTDEFNELSR